MQMKLDVLLGQLSAAGIQAVVIPACDGGKIVVTPHGARVLGVFTHEGAENAFWVNPELAQPESAQKFLDQPHVLGGDRLWMAPERGLNFRGNAEADGYVLQPSMDPGNWVVGKLTDTSIRLMNDFNIEFFQKPGTRVRGIVERSIKRAHSPLAEKNPKVRYAGYQIASRFDLLEAPADDLYIGIWFLIQMITPVGGYLYAPTAGRTVVTDYYEPTGPDYLKVTDTHVRFKIDSVLRHKIGIRKNEVLGRVGYLTNANGAGEAMLVVRNFLNNPSANYADVPLHTPAGTQDSIQSYNHHTMGPAGFGELEYHAPGVCRSMAEPTVTDVNQVWVFTGQRSDLVAVAAKLLNLPTETFAI
jgi:hypothetical protein